MTQANLELLDALRAAGVPESQARAAAQSAAAVGDAATKADLAELKTWLAWRLVGGIVILLAAMATGFGLIGFLLSA